MDRHWETIEDEGREFCAVHDEQPECISIEYVQARDVVDADGVLIRSLPAGYLPTFTMDENCDYAPSRGVPMATKAAAIEAAYALVPLHLRAIARKFRPFAEAAQEVVEVSNG